MTQLDTVKTLFPAVDVFQTYVVPATGHGINYRMPWPVLYDRSLAHGPSDTTAYEAYQQIIHFILARGL